MTTTGTNLGRTGRYRRRLPRVIVTPALLFDLYAILESFKFDVHVSVGIGAQTHDGISLGEIALFSFTDREAIRSIELRAVRNDARVTISFERSSWGVFTALGDDDDTLTPVLIAVNRKLNELPFFWSWADTISLLAFAGIGVTYLLLVILPFVPAISGKVALGALFVPAYLLLLGTAVLAFDMGTMCRFVWVGDPQHQVSKVRAKWPLLARYIAIALWTIVAAVVAQIIGSFIWERILR